MGYTKGYSIPKARRLDNYDGRNVYLYTVRVRFHLTDTPDHLSQVSAHTAADAAWWVKDQLLCAGIQEPFTVSTRGPKGGLVEREAGWWSVCANIAHNRCTSPQQLPLDAPIVVYARSADWYRLRDNRDVEGTRQLLATFTAHAGGVA